MAMYIDTDTDTTDSNIPAPRIEIDFRSTCDEKIPLWKSWASKGRVQEAINQLLFLERQTRPCPDTETTARILVAIVQIYFEAKNWSALNEQILLLARKRSQPKQAVTEMVQECLTYIDKIPDKENQIKLIETLSFITEGRTYLKGETALLIRLLHKIKGAENSQPAFASTTQDVVPLNFIEPREKSRAKRRKPLDGQSKEILFNLNSYFNDLKDKDMTSIYETTSTKLVALSTGIPLSSVKRVMVESKRVLEEGKQFTSSKRVRRKQIPISDFERATIRQTIMDYYYDYYNEDKDFPSMKELHEKMKEKINYKGSINLLRTEISLLGFNWKKTEGASSILVEKHEIRFQRINFLVKISEYRSQGRPIVYTGETCIDTSQASKPTTKGNRLIVVHAGGMDGYISSALCMIATTKEKVGKTCHYLNSEEYVKWVNSQLIPNLQPRSVVVTDNIFYQNILENPTPSQNACKQEMLDWLDFRNIVYSSSMLKPQLYQLILQNKDRFKEYKIDSLLRKKKHSILRLPPFHPELNPIHKIWPMIKMGIANDKDLTNTENLMQLAEATINTISVEEWKNLCDQAIKEEKKFIGHDAAIDALTERLTMTVSETSEESEDENYAAISESEYIDYDHEITK